MRGELGLRSDADHLQQGKSMGISREGSFITWFPLAVLGSLHTFHTAIFKCKTKDNLPKLSRSIFLSRFF